MSLTLKSVEVERLADEVAEMTGETRTEAVRMALQERKERLALRVVPGDTKEDLLRFLREEIWPKIPPDLLGRGISQEEQDEILGYGPGGV
ncbi:MAG: type II toxin-antitoxin system VapB family antitoxin [Acidobacteriota bacterium]